MDPPSKHYRGKVRQDELADETKTHITAFPASRKALVNLRKMISKIKLILLVSIFLLTLGHIL